MNKKYVITAVHKMDAFHIDQKTLVGHWAYLDPTRFETCLEEKGWEHAETDGGLESEDYFVFYAVKVMPLAEYKKKHPNVRVPKAKIR